MAKSAVGSVVEEDKKLAEAIRQHPCLYDKNESDYHVPTVIESAWIKVASELNIDKDSAKKQFETLKKRYSRKRHDVRRAEQNEEVTDDQNSRAHERLKEYDFMSWLDPHIRYKSVKVPNTNGINGFSSTDPVNGYSNSMANPHGLHSDEILYIESKEVSEGHSPRLSDHGSSYQSVYSNYNNKTSSEEPAPKRQFKDFQPYVSNQFALPERLGPCQENPVSTSIVPPSRDCEDVFGEMVACEMKRIPSAFKSKAKLEITQCIFKYQMKQGNSSD